MSCRSAASISPSRSTMDRNDEKLTEGQLRRLADRVALTLAPITRLRAKKMLRPQSAAELYGVTPGYLRSIPLKDLPRVVQNPMTLYPADALERYFNTLVVDGR